MLIKSEIKYKDGRTVYACCDFDTLTTNTKHEPKDLKDGSVLESWTWYENFDSMVDLIKHIEETTEAEIYMTNVEWTREEKEIAINWLKNSFPISWQYCSVGYNDIDYYILAPIDDYYLTECLEDVEGYLEGDTGVYGNNSAYEWMYEEYSCTVEAFLEYDGTERQKLEYVYKCLEDSEEEYDVLNLENDIETYVDKEYIEQLRDLDKQICELKWKMHEIWFDKDIKLQKKIEDELREKRNKMAS